MDLRQIRKMMEQKKRYDNSYHGIQLSEKNNDKPKKEYHPDTWAIFHKHAANNGWYNNPKQSGLHFIESIVTQHHGQGYVGDDTAHTMMVENHFGFLNRKGQPRNNGSSKSDYGRDYKDEHEPIKANGKSMGTNATLKAANVPYHEHGLL